MTDLFGASSISILYSNTVDGDVRPWDTNHGWVVGTLDVKTNPINW